MLDTDTIPRSLVCWLRLHRFCNTEIQVVNKDLSTDLVICKCPNCKCGTESEGEQKT